MKITYGEAIREALFKELDTAKAGHNPNARKNIGFSRIIPFLNSPDTFFIVSTPYFRMGYPSLLDFYRIFPMRTSLRSASLEHFD